MIFNDVALTPTAKFSKANKTFKRRLFCDCLVAPRCRSAFPIFIQLGSFSFSSVDAFSASEEQVNEVNVFRLIFNRGLALGPVLSSRISKLGGRKR